MSASARFIDGERRLWVTDQDNDVSTSIAGANGFETIFDLSPATDIYYKLPKADHPQLGRQGNLRLRMTFPQEGGGSTEIGDDAKVRFIAQGPEEEDTRYVSREYRYGEFANADQYNADEVVTLQAETNWRFTEAGHLKIQVDNSTNGNDVDLSQTGGKAEVELFRGTEK